ncbi:conserved hypothetical protein [Leishmania major strain Friedlin]|uniref:Uncharacterized protein n=1 Tax=Leishmania major TaxID=5664 RepID=Q4Q0F9_LEIMA|nr:conserved hypothetical protein [Leishmania major strain Friedlin]CAG9584156.1 hypothetical_protein_-_conserved [Leishmania major strain Friedlin]CAJ09576.1 conserved hypothetical protein [Leishmania major strain Friedlin]|eukprot:XP_001687189.1 conserved hypothetical protein [Leishmania major strain Friedlin]
MQQARGPLVAGAADRKSTDTRRGSPIALADCSRLERNLTQALQLADAIATTPSTDFSTPAINPGDGIDGLALLASPSNSPTIDPALTLSHSSGCDPTASGVRSEVTGSPNDGSAAAVQQRVLRAKDNEIAHLRRTVQELSNQLHNALTTLDQREDTSAELQELKRTYDAEEERREKLMRHARLEMLESRVRYRAREENLAETYTTDVHAKATELLEPHTQEVHDKNFELMKEKIMLAQEVTTMRAMYKDLQEKYALLRHKTDLDGSATREMLQRSLSQKNEIASLRLQVKTTEDNLNAVVAEYDKKLHAESKIRDEAIQSLTRERDAARRDALQLQRELGQLRSAAGNVLAQRSELESFFYAALEEVRQGVVEERRQQLLENTTKGGFINAKQVSPVHTISSLLRVEAPGRLMLTDSVSPALSRSSSRAGWTVDGKGFPKRIAGAASRNTRPLAGIAAASSSSLARRPAPPGNTALLNLQASPHTESAMVDGALVTLPDATPSYLRRSEYGVPPLVARATDRCAAVAAAAVESGWCRTPCEEGAPFRLGLATVEDGYGAPFPAPTEQCGALDAAEVEDFSPLRSLPNAPTWQDVKRVDVSELRWVDKERVIQLLFKRIRQEGRQHARMLQHASLKSDPLAAKVDSVAPVEVLPSDATELGRDSLTFLTQQ